MIVFVPVALMVPVASLLPNTHAAVLPVLFFGMAINSVADLAAYSGSNVLVSPHLDFQVFVEQHLQLCPGRIYCCRARSLLSGNITSIWRLQGVPASAERSAVLKSC